ncbi:hypothetical protein PC116_g6325 [Phytophthora cactorum]|nr:hypothetical protein PC116_g6325 [Phytophthora cactorum]
MPVVGAPLIAILNIYEYYSGSNDIDICRISPQVMEQRGKRKVEEGVELSSECKHHPLYKEMELAVCKRVEGATCRKYKLVVG